MRLAPDWKSLFSRGMSPPSRICLIKPSALGDVVQTLPLLPVIAESFPKAEISWVIRRELQGLLEGHPLLAETIPVDRRPTVRQSLHLLTSLRQRRFDWCFDLQGLLRSAVMTMATGATLKIGLETAREGAHLAVHHTIVGTSRQIPPAERNARIAAWLGYSAELQPVPIPLTPVDKAFAENLLKNLPRPWIAVQPGAQWTTKRWPPQQFGQLLQRASRQWGGTIALIGSPGEASLGTEIAQHLATSQSQQPIVQLAGKTNLKQLAAVLESSDFLISNDSGPLHLAAAHGTPCLGLFTCTSAVRSGPPGALHEMVSTEIACAAGYHKTCPQRGSAHLACFEELSVERAWRGLQRLVQKNRLDEQWARKVA